MPERQSDRRTARGRHQRKVDERSTIDRFLIVCEGTKTEPNYFRAFRVPGDVIEITVHGTGYNTISLVEEAKRKADGDNFDQVWCVFDRDSFDKAAFNKAISLAEAYGFYVAYSNEAFELWYLLHFHYYDTAIHRSQYFTKLTKLLNRQYEKNSVKIYDLLFTRQTTAINNARKLYEENHSHSPADDNPSTTVFLLVEELRKFSR